MAYDILLVSGVHHSNLIHCNFIHQVMSPMVSLVTMQSYNITDRIFCVALYILTSYLLDN